MNRLQWMRTFGVVTFVAAAGLGADPARAYTAPYSTPPGTTLVDVSKVRNVTIPQFLWRRLGDANGNPVYSYDADRAGSSSCNGDCAKEFPPFVADAHARASGDWSIIVRDDHVKQWAYQGKPLYRYAGKDPDGEPVGGGFELENPAWHDPASKIYSPKPGWRRAAYLPEKSTIMPPSVELEALAIANGFGFVDAATHMTLYAAPISHKLSSDWLPVYAAALAQPLGEFSITKRKDDGTRQWTYRGEALYTYTGDYAPGDVKGIFTGDQSIQAALAYRNFIPTSISIAQFPVRGPLMTTTAGLTLYTVARYHPQYGGRETRDGYFVSYNDVKALGTEGCQGDCTTTWKPVLAPANAPAWGFWEVIARPDGSKQWCFKGSPVYTYIGDKRSGDIEGNNRHQIVYGGPQGQVVYADPGGDPRDPQPLLGKLSMQIAQAPAPAPENDIDVPNVGGKGAAATGAQAGATSAGGLTGDADRKFFNMAGAALYWHTVGLF